MSKKAKDILWAAKLRRPPVDNPHVVLDLAKIRKSELLSLILLIHGNCMTSVLLLDRRRLLFGCA